MTQSQADFAVDCMEAIENQDDPRWRAKDYERTEFNRLCPALGFRTPLGPQHKAFNLAHAKELVAQLRRRFVDVPSTTRNYQDGGRTPPLFSDRFVLRERPLTPVDGEIEVPTLQPGRWVLTTISGDDVKDSEVCGDPLKSVRADLGRREDWVARGCRVQVAARKFHATRYIVNCPANHRELVVEAARPQGFSVVLVGFHALATRIQGRRTGDCAN
jgi:hypothetical protein